MELKKRLIIVAVILLVLVNTINVMTIVTITGKASANTDLCLSSAPSIETIVNQTTRAAVFLSTLANVSTVCDEILLFNASVTPSLTSFNMSNSTGWINFTPAEGEEGTYFVNISVDKTGRIDHESFYLIIQGVDLDEDNVSDSDDNLLFNETDINTTGIDDINVTVNGEPLNATYNGSQTLIFSDGSTPLLNFTHNFSGSKINLQNITILKDTNSIVVNLNGQLLSNERKTLYLTDDNYAQLCVRDAVMTSIDDMSSDCTDAVEIDFDSCLGNSTGIRSGNITCIDSGSLITISNLTHSGVRGSSVATTSTITPNVTAVSLGSGGVGTAYVPPVSPEEDNVSKDLPTKEDEKKEGIAPTEQLPDIFPGLARLSFFEILKEFTLKYKYLTIGISILLGLILVVLIGKHIQKKKKNEKIIELL